MMQNDRIYQDGGKGERKMGKAGKSIVLVLALWMSLCSVPVFATEENVVGTLTMDTKSYIMAPGDIYDFRAEVKGDSLRQEELTVWSSRDGIAQVERIPNTDKYRITGRKTGVAYVIAEVRGVHASIRVTVREGAQQHGVAARSVSVLRQEDETPQDMVDVVIFDGVTVMEVAEMLEKNGICNEEEFLQAAKSNKFDEFSLIGSIPNAGSRSYKVEGYLSSGNYSFAKNSKPETVLREILKNTETKIDDSLRKEADLSGMTIDQIITLASLIQSESRNEKDMPFISAVLHNRLLDGEAHGISGLQCESTVWYPYRSKEDVPEEIRDNFTSMYNTYNFSGLPAGPICSPGAAAIKAALSPAQTNDYYYCYSESGTLYCAETAQAHNENMEKAGLTKRVRSN